MASAHSDAVLATAASGHKVSRRRDRYRESRSTPPSSTKMADAYRSHISRWLWLADKAGWHARPLDVDEIAFVEKIRETGRLGCDCGTLSDMIRLDYPTSDKYSPSYRDEQGRLDAHAQHRAMSAFPRAPQYHKIVTARCWQLELIKLQQKEYQQRLARWNRAIKAILRRRDGAYAQAAAELRIELADIELANRQASIERL